ncbi:hypothetical protein T06_14931 [Trichinella sp. T6]|nr:hypothetical protein T06_14931 [Trichinella sp. T6]
MVQEKLRVLYLHLKATRRILAFLQQEVIPTPKGQFLLIVPLPGLSIFKP